MSNIQLFPFLSKNHSTVKASPLYAMNSFISDICIIIAIQDQEFFGLINIGIIDAANRGA